MITVRKKYSPGLCVYKGDYNEIRWDVSGCNLRCHFCWSPASRPGETGDPCRTLSPDELVRDTIASIKDPSKTFIRFTGGEPTLQWIGLTDVLEQLRQGSPHKLPILIQTNGIEIGNGHVDLDELERDIEQRYIVELSFKGTNKQEFSLLTGRQDKYYDDQLKGYEYLDNMSKKSKNICVVAVLGVYHSSTSGGSKYAFVYPRTDKLLFENCDEWDTRFENIWRRATHRWVEPLRMSPIGVWRNLLRRCGADGVGILRNFSEGIANNVHGLFPSKPKSFDYVRRIVSGLFWK
jgi:uncharacterized Fe-S cluster-containing radical SAM superfamily protein